MEADGSMVCGDCGVLVLWGRRRSLPTLLRQMFLSRVLRSYRESYWGSAFSLAWVLTFRNRRSSSPTAFLGAFRVRL